MRIGLYPDPAPGGRWSDNGNGSIREFCRELALRGHECVGISPEQLIGWQPFPPIDVLHVNWTETLAARLARVSAWRALGVLGRLMPAAGQAWARNFGDLTLPTLRHPRSFSLIYEAHDLESNWLPEPGAIRSLDLMLKTCLLRAADAWVLHEDSSREPLLELAPPPRHEAVCPLGDFARFHGPAIAREEARRRLELPATGTLFVSLGHCSRRRDPRRLAEAFSRCARPDSRLLLAGSNVRQYLPDHDDPRITLRSGLLPAETVRDLLCAADWVVMEGRRYLTSAVVRTALDYGRPVIVHPFGCQSDMAREAALWIRGPGPDALGAAIREAENCLPATYQRLAWFALARASERTWERTMNAYQGLLLSLGHPIPASV